MILSVRRLVVLKMRTGSLMEERLAENEACVGSNPTLSMERKLRHQSE